MELVWHGISVSVGFTSDLAHYRGGWGGTGELSTLWFLPALLPAYWASSNRQSGEGITQFWWPLRMAFPETYSHRVSSQFRELPKAPVLLFLPVQIAPLSSTGSDAFGKHLEHPLKPSHAVHSGVLRLLYSLMLAPTSAVPRNCLTFIVSTMPKPQTSVSYQNSSTMLSTHTKEPLDLKLSSILCSAQPFVVSWWAYRSMSSKIQIICFLQKN